MSCIYQMSQQGASKCFADTAYHPLIGSKAATTQSSYRDLLVLKAWGSIPSSPAPATVPPCSSCHWTASKLRPLSKPCRQAAYKSEPKAGKQRVNQYPDGLVSSSELGYAPPFIRLNRAQ